MPGLLVIQIQIQAMWIPFNKLPWVHWEYSADDGDGMSKTIITTACTNLLLYEWTTYLESKSLSGSKITFWRYCYIFPVSIKTMPFEIEYFQI